MCYFLGFLSSFTGFRSTNVLLFDWLTKKEEMFSSVDSNVAQIAR